MSEAQRIQNEMNALGEIYRLKGELLELRDERDRLRTRALTEVERWRAQTNVKEGISFRMAMKALEAALTPAGGEGN